VSVDLENRPATKRRQWPYLARRKGAQKAYDLYSAFAHRSDNILAHPISSRRFGRMTGEAETTTSREKSALQGNPTLHRTKPGEEM
jgi:hypothetical protein